MDRKPERREYSNARRRPSGVNRTQGQNPVRPSSSQPNRQQSTNRPNVNPQNVQREPNRSGEYSFRQGQRTVHPQAGVPARRETALTKRNDKKLAKIEKAERLEEEWQKDIVRTRSAPDFVMLVLVIILLALGTIMVFSTSYPYAIFKKKPADYYIIRQVIFLIAGGTAMVTAMILPARWFRGLKIANVIPCCPPKLLFVLSGIMLVITSFFGTSEGVTQRWINIGGVNIQPSELMKLAMILMLAWYVSEYEHEIMTPLRFTGARSKKYNVFYPLLICGLGCILIIVGRHLSGMVITALIAFFMIIVSGIEMKSFMKVAAPIGGAVIAGYLMLFPYAFKRISTMFDKTNDILGADWQITQSVYAIGSGGLFGVNLGESRQKYNYLAGAHTDFIFSVWCEELGYIGAVALIVLFLVFIWRGYVIALRAPDKFTMMTAFGITTHIGLQAFLNMMVATAIMPNTGIPLPFFSYGGSSTLVVMGEMGILLSISRQAYKTKSELEREVAEERLGMD